MPFAWSSVWRDVGFIFMVDLGPNRIRRLAEELEEGGLPSGGNRPLRAMLLDEVDYALRPPVHERRVASSGTILRPRTNPASWAPGRSSIS